MRRAFLRLWWLGLPPAAGLLYAAGAEAERGAVLAALAACLAAVVWEAGRRRLAAAAGLLLWAAVASLAAHLMGDDFTYRYVWLYSAETLPWYLKLSNLWGGDEGTMLLLAAFGGALGVRLVRRQGWAGPGALLVTAVFALGALIWDPFVPTPAADLARLASQGMNAHLTRVWMAFHPPQIFAAYMLFLAPAGAALEALATGGGDWARIAPRYMRAGWLVLSLGLVLGMWWAYEDFAFGSVWHWDPVQTSVFVVWALATAQLHCLRRYKPNGAFAIVHPLLALLAAAAALGSMAVTRSPALASSHRYVGDSSLPLLLGAALALIALTGLALVAAARRRQRRPRAESAALIRIATLILALSALVATGYVAEAYVSAYLGLPRPESLKPFFETLTRWSKPAELDELRAAFGQWDIDNFGLNRWLAPLGVAIGLVGGHNFCPIRRRERWLVTALVVLAAGAAAVFVDPVGSNFRGTGMTSNKTVAIFPWLDALGVSTGYLALAVLAWALVAARRGGRMVLDYYAPVGVLHLGVTMALAAAVIATVFDTYAQKMVDIPIDFSRPQRFPGGYTVTVRLGASGSLADGARTDRTAGGFRAIADVGWTLSRDGRVIESRSGHTVYRDDRAPLVGDRSPVRLMCEVLDYRYARYVSDSRQMIHPFIYRGLWRDVQVWFPALDEGWNGAAGGATKDVRPRPPTRTPIVLKVFPAMTWFWLGLGLTFVGAAAAAWRAPGGLSRRKTTAGRPVDYR